MAGATIALMEELKLFFRAVGSHWLTLMSGGVIIVAVGIFERAAGRNVSWSIYIAIISAFFVIASFLSWRDKQREFVEKQQDVEKLKRELADEREPVRREFDAIRMGILTSTLAPVIVQGLGNLRECILRHRELMQRKDVGDFFIKWIKPHEIHIEFGAQLDLTNDQYMEMKRDLANIGSDGSQPELAENKDGNGGSRSNTI